MKIRTDRSINPVSFEPNYLVSIMQHVFDGNFAALEKVGNGLVRATQGEFSSEISKCVVGFKAPVVGNFYATQCARAEYDRLKAGEKLSLKFEPTNKFDVNAIAVYSGLHMLGHVDRSSAQYLAIKLNKILNDFDVTFYTKHKIILNANVKAVAANNSRMIIEVTSVTFKKEEN